MVTPIIHRKYGTSYTPASSNRFSTHSPTRPGANMPQNHLRAPTRRKAFPQIDRGGPPGTRTLNLWIKRVSYRLASAFYLGFCLRPGWLHGLWSPCSAVVRSTNGSTERGRRGQSTRCRVGSYHPLKGSLYSLCPLWGDRLGDA